MEKCIFCQIVAGELPSVKVWENDEFIAIKNKYPTAPFHLLVLPKKHVEKNTKGEYPKGFWDSMMKAVFSVITQEGLDKKGFQLLNHGAGYQFINHEHIHIKSGIEVAE